MGIAAEIAVGAVASLVSVLIVAGLARTRRVRRAQKGLEWFGSNRGDEWLVLMPRYHGDSRALSFRLVDALTELVQLAASLGCHVKALPNDERQELGAVTEVTVGGLDGGSHPTRAGTHIQTWIPALTVEPWDEDAQQSRAFVVDGQRFEYEGGKSEYVAVARLSTGLNRRPLFVIVGQGSRSDHAGCRYLHHQHRMLQSRFGDQSFALLLHVSDYEVYGPSMVAEVKQLEVVNPQPPAAHRG